METRSAARNRNSSGSIRGQSQTAYHSEVSSSPALDRLQTTEHRDVPRKSHCMLEQRALLRLSILTTAVWLCAITQGIFRNNGIPPVREELPFKTFDRVLRLVGPAVPLAVMLIRYLAYLPLGRLPGPDTDNSSSGTFLHLAAVYAALTVVRWGIYVLHVLLAPTVLRSWKRPGSLTTDLMSDHIFLGASLIAILTSEGHQLAAHARGWHRRSNATSQSHTQTHNQSSPPGAAIHRRLVIVAMVVWTLLVASICTDMYTTARHFHEPRESVAAAVAGVFVFQVPMTIYLCLHRVHLSSPDDCFSFLKLPDRT